MILWRSRRFFFPFWGLFAYPLWYYVSITLYSIDLESEFACSAENRSAGRGDLCRLKTKAAIRVGFCTVPSSETN